MVFIMASLDITGHRHVKVSRFTTVYRVAPISSFPDAPGMAVLKGDQTEKQQPFRH